MSLVVKPLEPLIEGKHYRRLSAREGAGRYRFATLQDITFVHPWRILRLEDRIVEFYDDHDHMWMLMHGNRQTIMKDYWWNGCSPKHGFELPFGGSLWVGTPDLKSSIPASLKHDGDFQFSNCEHYPLNLERANSHFRQIMAYCGDPVMAKIYHMVLSRCAHSYWQQDDNSYSIAR